MGVEASVTSEQYLDVGSLENMKHESKVPLKDMHVHLEGCLSDEMSVELLFEAFMRVGGNFDKLKLKAAERGCREYQIKTMVEVIEAMQQGGPILASERSYEQTCIHEPVGNFDVFLDRMQTGILRVGIDTLDDLYYLVLRLGYSLMKTHDKVNMLYCPFALDYLPLVGIVRVMETASKEIYNESNGRLEITFTPSLRRGYTGDVFKGGQVISAQLECGVAKPIIDISGGELNSPLYKYVDALNFLEKWGGIVTIHSGEVRGTQDTEVLFDLVEHHDSYTNGSFVGGIRHGLYLFPGREDVNNFGDMSRRRLDLLVERGVTIDTCPVSSAYIGKATKQEIIRWLRILQTYGCGLTLGLGSDDPALLPGKWAGPSLFMTNIASKYLIYDVGNKVSTAELIALVDQKEKDEMSPIRVVGSPFNSELQLVPNWRG